jgi:hypothetical protein
MLTIWGRLNSHNVKKVVWAACEAGSNGSATISAALSAIRPNIWR